MNTSQKQETPEAGFHRHRSRFYRVVVWIFLISGSLIAAWGLLFVALPSFFLHDMVESWLSGTFNAPVTLRKITLNPLTLQLNVDGIRVPYPELSMAPLDNSVSSSPDAGEISEDSEALLTLEQITLTPHWSSLWKTGQVITNIRMVRPVLDIVYLGNGAFSFSRLLPAPDASPVAATGLEAWKETLSKKLVSLFFLNHLDVVDGTVFLRDASLGITHSLKDIRLSVPFALPSDTGAQNDTSPRPIPTLSARFNDTPIHLTGELLPSGDTLRTRFTLRTALFGMEYFRRYLAAFTPLRLNNGAAQLALSLLLLQPEQGRLQMKLSGTIHLENMDIANPQGETVGKLRTGEIRLEDFTLSQRRILLQGMELDGLYLKVRRNKDGRLDWENWLHSAVMTDSTPPVQKHTPSETPFIVEGADLTLRNSDFTLIDPSLFGDQPLNITGVDGRIARYSTRPGAETAMRLSFGLNTEGVVALEGKGTLNPELVDAQLMIKDLPLTPVRPLLKGSLLEDMLGYLDMKGHIAMTGGEKKTAGFSLSKGNLSLRSFSFGRGTTATTVKGKLTEGTPAVRIEKLVCDGLSLKTGTRTLALTRLSVLGPTLRFSSAPFRLAIPGQKSLPSGTATAPFDFASLWKTSFGGWNVAINAVQVDKGKLIDIAESNKTPLISTLRLETGALTSNSQQTVAFTLRATGKQQAQINMKGTLRPEPLQVKTSLRAETIALELAAPWLRTSSYLSLQGQASADFQISFQEVARKRRLDIQGSVSLKDVQGLDRRTSKRFAMCRRLTAERFRYASVDRSLVIGQLLVDRGRLDITLTPQGKYDLTDILFRQSASSATPLFSKLDISTILIQDSRLLFKNQQLAPPTTTFIQNLNGSLSSLSVFGNTPAVLKLTAQIYGAPAQVEGEMNPFRWPPVAHLRFSVRNLDLSRYASYTRTYLGYPVEQGNLTVSGSFDTSGSLFTMRNNLVLEGVRLGPKDTRPGAPNYPVPLGIALMEDRNGTIRLDVPIQGGLNDASLLQISGLMGKALGGLLTKIVTSPLAIVEGLFSFLTPNAPELYQVPFTPGRHVLPQRTQIRLKDLVKLLQDRPRLRLGLVGSYERASDTAGLKQEWLLHQLQGLKQPGKAPSDKEAVRFSPQEYEDLLFRFFKAAAVTHKRLKSGEIQREEPDVMERKLKALVPVKESDLQALAKRRAESLRSWLLAQDPALRSRITLLQDASGSLQVREGAARVELQLR